MAKLTADTITDEQIRELRRALAWEIHSGHVLASDNHHAIAKELGDTSGIRPHKVVREEWDACNLALGRVRNSQRVKGYRARARARCAEILNAREVQS